MHDHEDTQAPGPARARECRLDGGAELGALGPAIEARRPDTLGRRAVLDLQRLAGNAGVGGLVTSGEEESPVKAVVRSQGTALDPTTRSTMEASFGHDFGDVQVHHDAVAGSSAQSVQAQAYTVGNHIVFGAGSYRPDSAQGQRTIAHELAHVVQQRSGPVDGSPAPGGISVSHPSDRFEQEAEQVADRVVSGSMSPVQRQEAEPGEMEEDPAEEPASVQPAGFDVQRQEDPDEEDLSE